MVEYCEPSVPSDDFRAAEFHDRFKNASEFEDFGIAKHDADCMVAIFGAIDRLLDVCNAPIEYDGRKGYLQL
jgi:hypothetical protein